jgi:hypothetical protein
LIDVSLALGRAGDSKGAIIAGCVAQVVAHDVNENQVPWSDHSVRKVMGVGIASWTGDAVNPTDAIDAVLDQPASDQSYNFVFSHTGSDKIGYLGINTIDQRSRKLNDL